MTTHIARRQPIIAAALIVVLFVLVSFIAGAPAHAEGDDQQPLTSTELIHDDADILDDQRVVDALNKIERLDKLPDAQVAIYTTDNVDKGNYDADITALIKEENDPLIMEDGLIRDNIVVIAISPEARKIGAYAREGSALENRSAVEAATREMTSHAREADWDNTAFAGASAYLEKVGVVAQGETSDDREKAESEVAIAFFLMIIIVITATILILTIRYSIKRLNIRRRRRKKFRELKSHSRYTLEKVRGEWETLAKLQHGLPITTGMRWPANSNSNVRIIDEALNEKPELYRINEHLDNVSIEELVNPRSIPDNERLIQLSEYPSIDGKKAWNDVISSIENKHIKGIREIDEEIEVLNVPEKSANILRKRAERTIEALDKEIDSVKKSTKTINVFDSLEYIHTLIEDFEGFAERTMRSLSPEDYAEIMPPRKGGQTSDHRADHWERHGYLVPAYLMGAYAATATSHSTSYGSVDSSSSSYSSPTTFTGGFSGGGFSGGSSSF